jgi:hypothetical protein
MSVCGPSSSVGIATGYGLDGPGIESRWRRDFPHRPWNPTSLLYNGYRVFPEGKERAGRDADPSPLLVPLSRKSRAMPLLLLQVVRPVQSLSACTRLTFTFLLLLCLFLYWVIRFKQKAVAAPVTCTFLFLSHSSRTPVWESNIVI